jgi:Uncharacterised nucleotidyltransferase/Transglutaminase-like superfamily
MQTSASRSLLLACARASLSPEDKSSVKRLLEQPVDWQDLLKGALWHGVTQLVAMNLHGLPNVPDWVKRDLGRFDRVNAFRSLHLSTQIRKVVDHLEERGIETIAWKGPALAFEAYGGLTRRSSCDIDFLVKPGELTAARNSLLDAGFVFEPGTLSLSPERRSRMERISGEVRLLGPDRSFLLELHQQFMPPSTENPAILLAMWRRSYVATAWDGKPIRRLFLSDLLLTLCVHAAKHAWDRLKWVADIGAVVDTNRDRIDWTDLFASADSYGMRGMLLFGLGLAQRNVGALLPATVSSELNARSAVTQIIERQDSAYTRDTLSVRPSIRSLQMRVACEPFPKKIKIIAKEVVAPTCIDLAAFPCSDRWLWLAPFFRPWSTGRTHLRRGLRHLGDRRPLRWCARWGKLSRSDQYFLFQALLALFLVRVALYVSTFRRILAMTDRWSPPAIPFIKAGPPNLSQCTELIPAAAQFIPQASCLTQAIAGKWLLRATGEKIELQVGVAKRAGKFTAHAVLLHGDQVLLGRKPPEQTYRPIFNSCAHQY